MKRLHPISVVVFTARRAALATAHAREFVDSLVVMMEVMVPLESLLTEAMKEPLLGEAKSKLNFSQPIEGGFQIVCFVRLVKLKEVRVRGLKEVFSNIGLFLIHHNRS